MLRPINFETEDCGFESKEYLSLNPDKAATAARKVKFPTYEENIYRLIYICGRILHKVS
jgi:hypothetical protein